jgi:hypothetical protein
MTEYRTDDLADAKARGIDIDRTGINRSPIRDRTPGGDLNTALVGAELAELTRQELFVLAPMPGRLERLLPLDLFDRLLDRKVTVRILYPARSEPPADRFQALIRAGAALPTTLDLPYFLVVRDRSVAYLPHQDPQHPLADRLTRVRNVVMAGSIATAFSEIWDTSVRRASAAALEDVDAHEVLQVLSDGLTDDRAAARLHMSKRTFARRVAAMMEELEASSRFQAGVRAVRRGWV